MSEKRLQFPLCQETTSSPGVTFIETERVLELTWRFKFSSRFLHNTFCFTPLSVDCFRRVQHRIPTRKEQVHIYSCDLDTGNSGNCNLARRSQIKISAENCQCRLQRFQIAVIASTLWLYWQNKSHSKILVLVQNAYINHASGNLICLMWTWETHHRFPTGHAASGVVFMRKKVVRLNSTVIYTQRSKSALSLGQQWQLGDSTYKVG